MGLEEEVLDKIQQISKAETTGSYDAIKQRLSQKRIAWYAANKDSLHLNGPPVRQAYELILLHYMHLAPEEVPVVFEDDRKIVWRSYNWCPVLEACKRLGIDTRKACKAGWEESVQELAQQVDTRLRFSRNYSILRPHGEYCEETIELVE